MTFDLKKFSDKMGFTIKHQELIVEEAVKNIIKKQNLSTKQIKEKFDTLFYDTEKEAYNLYLYYEKEYGKKVFKSFINSLIESGEIEKIENLGNVLGEYFHTLDRFFLSIAQSRKSRAGRTIEGILNSLFKTIKYPFEEQVVINGKPDFLMPSEKHYRKNAPDCIIFTTKRTTRERWRQIVTEGTRGLGFYLSTIDSGITKKQLKEMLNHRIYIVCPQIIKDKYYNNVVNVLSFKEFFRDHLDPAMERWKENKAI